MTGWRPVAQARCLRLPTTVQPLKQVFSRLCSHGWPARGLLPKCKILVRFRNPPLSMAGPTGPRYRGSRHLFVGIRPFDPWARGSNRPTPPSGRAPVRPSTKSAPESFNQSFSSVGATNRRYSMGGSGGLRRASIFSFPYVQEQLDPSLGPQRSHPCERLRMISVEQLYRCAARHGRHQGLRAVRWLWPITRI
jgi:hypothetical protein